MEWPKKVMLWFLLLLRTYTLTQTHIISTKSDTTITRRSDIEDCFLVIGRSCWLPLQFVLLFLLELYSFTPRVAFIFAFLFLSSSFLLCIVWFCFILSVFRFVFVFYIFFFRLIRTLNDSGECMCRNYRISCDCSVFVWRTNHKKTHSYSFCVNIFKNIYLILQKAIRDHFCTWRCVGCKKHHWGLENRKN